MLEFHWCTAARSRTEARKPPLRPSFLYLSTLPCSVHIGGHYEKQWHSQKAVIAFTEQLIRGKCSMHRGIKQVSCMPHTHTHTHASEADLT